jgi:capsule biosynthesis phosphatase
MIILIPLGGFGCRFKNAGYNLPKPLINVMGKPIIFWLLDSINPNKNDFVLIPYNNELYKYRFEDLLRKTYPNINFIFHKLEFNTGGASETIKIALETLKNIEDQPILCLDCDNFYTCDILSKWNKKNQVFTFKDSSNESIYSYINIINDIVKEIKEKEKISDFACTGAYGFESWNILLKYCKHIIENNIKQKNEFYTSTVISEMIKNNYKFTNNLININNYICLGTPIQVRLFCNNFHKMIYTDNIHLKKQRYCFDLDNTLVTFPKIDKDYTTVEPIHNNIKFLKYLKSLGNEIIIYTARNMKTNNGNVGKCNAKIGKITLDTLEQFDIPYDEIYFGKPHADYYIDDLAISSYDDLEKTLGYYNTQIEPRSFNNLNVTNMEIYKKSSSKSLQGEIYYYNNIPKQIRELFPKLINYDSINYKWYDIEKINGVTLTHLYLSGELTSSLLETVMNSLHQIHCCTCTIESNSDINIYYNYTDKVKERFSKYDYSRFSNYIQIYDEIITGLQHYQNTESGKKGIIHGDPVLTNILVNEVGRIKFIDMRGTVNNQLTLYGDIFYDYGKLLQSLIGYDEILQNKYINLEYKKFLIDNFNKLFLKLYTNDNLKYVKLIVKSLLFSLIPLHDNDKCIQYYNLINSDFLK